MIDEWFYKNYHKHREAIDKFWKERPEGMKLCPYCQNIFDTPGFPVEGSWTCTEWCFDATNFRDPIIPMDTSSRVYLIDLPSTLDKMLLEPTQYFEEQEEKKDKIDSLSLDWAHELTLKNTEKKIRDLLEGDKEDED